MPQNPCMVIPAQSFQHSGEYIMHVWVLHWWKLCAWVYDCGQWHLLQQPLMTADPPIWPTINARRIPQPIQFYSTWAHDDIIKWKHFPSYWPFVWGIHRSPMNCPHKGQWCGALMSSLFCASTNSCPDYSVWQESDGNQTPGTLTGHSLRCQLYSLAHQWASIFHLPLRFDGLVQERCNSSALAMELHLSCTNPSTWAPKLWPPRWEAITWTNADQLDHKEEHSMQIRQSHHCLIIFILKQAMMFPLYFVCMTINIFWLVSAWCNTSMTTPQQEIDC